jgi:putative Mg2+ transporter-C (MgtC) family protein
MHPDPLIVSAEVIYIWRIVAAAVLGTIVGLERSLAGKQAGMRTYALVSLGSCVFALVSTLASYELVDFAHVNPTQIAASIVVGVGFIGAGLAATRNDHVELTTASGIWVVAAIGMACGYGLLNIAIATTILVMAIFSFEAFLERWLRLHWGIDN